MSRLSRGVIILAMIALVVVGAAAASVRRVAFTATVHAGDDTSLTVRARRTATGSSQPVGARRLCESD